MKLSDLITNIDGSLSHTKIWSNIAYGAGTYKFCMTPNISPDIWLIYLGVVGSAQVASKFLSLKFQGGSTNVTNAS